MKKVIIGGLLGGLVMIIWQSVSWMAIPWHMPQSIPNEDIVAQVLQENITEPGLYSYPGFNHDPDANAEEQKAAMDSMIKKGAQGPRVMQLVYTPHGGSFMDPSQFIFGYGANFLLAILAAWLLSTQNPAKVNSYSKRLLFVVVIGLIVSFSGPYMNWNWWKYPGDFAFQVFADDLILWTLTGAMLAWRVKPE